MTELAAYPELISEAARGDIAIWLASELDPARLVAPLAKLPWIAIWTESRADQFTEQLTSLWASSSDERVRQRYVMPIDKRPTDQLGDHGTKRICPAFFLNGRGAGWTDVGERDRRRIRDSMVDELIRYGPARVVVEGPTTAEACLVFLADEVPSAATQLRVMFCGVPSAERELLRGTLASRPELRERVGAVGLSVSELIDALAGNLEQSEVLSAESIRIGSATVRLGGLLRRDPPFDQAFQVLTADLLSKARSVGEANEALIGWMEGRAAPWRAMHLGSHWQRAGAVEPILSWVLKRVTQHQLGSNLVLVLNVCGEPGSGLTNVLRLIGIRLAALGYPTLFRPEHAGEIDEAGLRQFTSIVGEHRGYLPVLVLDAMDQTLEGSRGIRDLPRLLARDGAAVIVRGVQCPVRPGASSQALEEAFRKAHALSPPGKTRYVDESWYAGRLRADLNEAERADLVAWAAAHWPKFNAEKFRRALASWKSEGVGDSERSVPLLTCLYYLITGELEGQAGVGRHLVSWIRKFAGPEAEGRVAGDQAVIAPLTGESLKLEIARLQKRFDTLTTEAAEPTPDEAAAVYIVLAALAAARRNCPRRVLADLAGVPEAQMGLIVSRLEACGVASSNPDGPVPPRRERLAPTVSYGFEENVGLRHQSFGRIALHWLSNNRRTPEGRIFEGCGLASEVLSRFTEDREFDYPVAILAPLLKRVRPSPSHVRFVSELSVEYLRLQKHPNSEYFKELWRDRGGRWEDRRTEALRRVWEAIPEHVVVQSAVILHSRAMLYKTCAGELPPEVYRARYQAADRDLDLAFRIADEDRGRAAAGREDPANVVTSRGLLHEGWEKLEFDAGDLAAAAAVRGRAYEYLEEGLRRRSDNPFAAFGLATLLLRDVSRAQMDGGRGELSTERIEELGKDIERAFNYLLAFRPADRFEERWESQLRSAFQLLQGDAGRLIGRLKSEGKELGYALEALLILPDHEIPREPHADHRELEVLRRAEAALEEAPKAIRRTSALANMLRYAIFSAQRGHDDFSQFRERLDRLRLLKDTVFLKQPDWLYDFAMLSLQLGEHESASQAFSELRRGRKYEEVPSFREIFLLDPASPSQPLAVPLRVLRVDQGGQAWARVERLPGFKDPVALQSLKFAEEGEPVKPGGTILAWIRIRAFGPVAEPLPRQAPARDRPRSGAPA